MNIDLTKINFGNITKINDKNFIKIDYQNNDFIMNLNNLTLNNFISDKLSYNELFFKLNSNYIKDIIIIDSFFIKNLKILNKNLFKHKNIKYKSILRNNNLVKIKIYKDDFKNLNLEENIKKSFNLDINLNYIWIKENIFGINLFLNDINCNYEKKINNQKILFNNLISQKSKNNNNLQSIEEKSIDIKEDNKILISQTSKNISNLQTIDEKTSDINLSEINVTVKNDLPQIKEEYSATS